MKLLADSELDGLRWLVDLDLRDYRKCGEVRWLDLAARFEKGEPWLHIAVPNRRTQAILVCLQNQVRGEVLRKRADEVKQLEDRLHRLRNTLAETKVAILQGVEEQDYRAAWQLWKMGDERRLRSTIEKIERDRAAWRAKCERADKAVRQLRRKLHAEALRHRATGIAVEVDWFARMPVYNHRTHNDAAPWGYCQATGQDRWTVKDFLREKKQERVGKVGRKGAGKPLDLYGFKTNLLVLGKWLGDWLLNKPHKLAEDEPKAERVCDSVVQTLSYAAICEHSDEQAEQLRTVLRIHWRKWKQRVKDQERLAADWWAETDAALSLGAEAWRGYRAERRAQWADIGAKIRAGYKMKNGVWVQAERPSGPMPYGEVKVAWDRLLWLQW